MAILESVNNYSIIDLFCKLLLFHLTLNIWGWSVFVFKKQRLVDCFLRWQAIDQEITVSLAFSFLWETIPSSLIFLPLLHHTAAQQPPRANLEGDEGAIFVIQVC